MKYYSSETICEIVPTIQGEIKVGEPVIMVRFKGCNLHCSWCDTKYSWKNDEISKITDNDINAILNIQKEYPNIKTLMITGGEPLLYSNQDKFYEILSLENFNHVQIETNGTMLGRFSDFVPENFRHYTTINISPKLDKTYYKDLIDYKELLIAIKDYIPHWRQYPFMLNMNLKFVYYSEIENEILNFINKFNNSEFGPRNIFIMSKSELLANCDSETGYIHRIKYRDIETIKFCMKYGFNFTPRYHTFLFCGDNKEMLNQ